MKRFLYWLWRVIPLSKRMRAPILWLGNRKFVIGISAFILNDQGEVLLFKHTYRNDVPWSFPGGYLKKNEDPDDAMKREIFEESGFEINILKPLEVARSHEMARFEVLYQAELVGEADFVPSIEVVEARFFPVNALPELLHEHKAIIDKYLKLGDG